MKQLAILCLCTICLMGCYDERSAVVGTWGILRIDPLHQGAELPEFVSNVIVVLEKEGKFSGGFPSTYYQNIDKFRDSRIVNINAFRRDGKRYVRFVFKEENPILDRDFEVIPNGRQLVLRCEDYQILLERWM
ncbi:MAG: hypothetical protein J0L99_05930 [Chitinophagales bacterium]|nr:hypothetical protein [Chitinophagales bacterium]